ncbi:hypothetical protein JKP88DRAFT_262072 [Tribonema minus]|uniref:Uncharacterized protein n=1 Tax=Tribonema minus TaxID=303371 RepID=A0A836CLI6_9STRA|nr:hypothetical protein JKP88DRAFT_262072 [Tribonema minus]
MAPARQLLTAAAAALSAASCAAQWRHYGEGVAVFMNIVDRELAAAGAGGDADFDSIAIPCQQQINDCMADKDCKKCIEQRKKPEAEANVKPTCKGLLEFIQTLYPKKCDIMEGDTPLNYLNLCAIDALVPTQPCSKLEPDIKTPAPTAAPTTVAPSVAPSAAPTAPDTLQPSVAGSFAPTGAPVLFML